VSYLEKFELLSKHQFGFGPGIGMENGFYSAAKFICEALDKGKKTLTIFLDIAKVFATIYVDNSILISLLPSFNIKSSYLNWFKSYLQNRKH